MAADGGVNERHDAVLAKVRQLIADGMSGNEVGRAAGISGAAVSQLMSGTYAGSVDNMVAKLERWLSARDERSELLAGLPTAPTWFESPTAVRITRTLNYAQVANDLVLVVGGAGQSKTTTCRRYATEWPNVWHVEMTKSHGRQLATLERIAKRLDCRCETRAPAALQDAIGQKVRGTQGLLIIDEAQHLETASLEAVRAIHDETGIGLALVGNESIYGRLTGGTRSSDHAQLFSRIGKVVKLNMPTAGDVAALCDAWALQDLEARKLVAAIAAKPGALRVATKALRLASVMAGGEPVTGSLIKQAWQELGVVS